MRALQGFRGFGASECIVPIYSTSKIKFQRRLCVEGVRVQGVVCVCLYAYNRPEHHI